MYLDGFKVLVYIKSIFRMLARGPFQETACTRNLHTQIIEEGIKMEYKFHKTAKTKLMQSELVIVHVLS